MLNGKTAQAGGRMFHIKADQDQIISHQIFGITEEQAVKTFCKIHKLPEWQAVILCSYPLGDSLGGHL